MVGAAMCVPSAMGFDQAGAEVKLEQTPDSSNILIVCYSRSGNTKAMAETIRDATKGTLFEIVPEQPYPEEYRAATEQAKKEITEGVKSALKSNLESIAAYDVIFVGTPCWWSTMAPPVATFLASHDFEGKTIIPFITHEGSGLGRYVEDVKKLAPKATVLEGKAVRGRAVTASRNDINAWLRQLNAIR